MLNEKRSKYYVFEDKYIQEADEEIVKALDAGHKVLVVVNTVGLCQQLAMELKEYNPVCFHSRFIQKDRKRIEKVLIMLILSLPHRLLRYLWILILIGYLLNVHLRMH